MIIGLNFEKVRAQRLSVQAEKVTVNNSIKIVDVEEGKFQLSKDRVLLKFHFQYIVNYEPKVANLEMAGYLSYLTEADSPLLKEFHKNKAIKNGKVTAQVMNAILNKCNIKAVMLAQDLNIPLPITLPKVQMKTSEASYIG